MKIFVNLITTSRFLYTIILPIFSVNLSNRSFILNIIALFLTDLIDGVLARKFKVQSLYGAVMDAVADKALCIFLLIALIYNNTSFITIMILEIVIALINTIAFFCSKKAFSRMFGKVKMWSISISIILGYMVSFELIDSLVSNVIIFITILLQVCTIIDYITSIISQKGKKKEHVKIKTFKDLKYMLFNTEYYLSIK